MPILSLAIILLSLPFCFGSNKYAPMSQATINVNDYGAIGNDRNLDNEAFEKAWSDACSQGATLLVPENKIYLLKPINFSGPCQPNTKFMIYGKIKAWAHLPAYEQDPSYWIKFNGITGLIVDGSGMGYIHGNGKTWWRNSCKVNKNLPCTVAPNAVTFYGCNNLIVRNMKFMNPQKMHMKIENCLNVRISSLMVRAPGNSPNTDGIHLSNSQNIFISNTFIATGDDCISIETGSSNVQVTNIICGPGHGISIGSLGDNNSKAEVSNVLVNRAKFTGTTNGVRIKTYQGGSGYARHIQFTNIEMKNVSNPIIVDQNYCDQQKPCQEQESAVKVSNLAYQNISGTSASQVAIKFNCSKTVPCSNVYFQDVTLEAEGGGQTTASCNNVVSVDQGSVFPIPCQNI